jgi:hypothetical protein
MLLGLGGSSQNQHSGSLRWLCWKPGSDHSIIVGKDHIIGLGNASFLSPPLITHLNTKNTYFLYQARLSSDHGTQDAGWKSGNDFELPSDLVMEWENYCTELSRASITLNDSRIICCGTEETILATLLSKISILPLQIQLGLTISWLAQTVLELENSTQDQAIYLDYFGKQNPHLGFTSEKRVDWSKYMPTLLQG